MVMNVSMPIEEFEDIKLREYRRGEDAGMKSAIRHIRWLMTSKGSTQDRLVFNKDLDVQEAYDGIREFIKEAYNGNKT